jgi:UDP-MurNAc hydroxylase
VLADPWLRGDAFNDGWRLHPAAVLGEDALARVTHVWFSHEHPDHLSIPTLRSIPEERRAGITALYQRHWSPEVVTFLRGLGFASVVELSHGDPVVLGDEVEVTLFQVGHEDSALLVRTPSFTALDLNDCKPTAAALGRLAQQVGRVDLLLDQFSIAGWPGNPDDTERLAAAGRRTLDQLREHVDRLQPHWVLPYASFVRFSHEENAFMNRAVNGIDEVVRVVGRERLVVMYPGDEWDTAGGAPFAGTDDAVARYRKDQAAIAELPVTTSAPRTFDEIVAAARDRLADLHRAYHAVLLRRVRPVVFHVTDLGRSLLFDPGAGLAYEVAPGAGECVVEVGSQAAWYTFAHRWGLTTLLISGRFRLRGDESRFRRLKQLGAVYSGGMYSRGAVRTVASPRVLGQVRRRWRNLWSDFAARAGARAA